MTVEPAEISTRQRARAALSGKGVSTALHGNVNAESDPVKVKKVTANPHKDNYKTASQFYAGPSKPGKPRVQLNEAAQTDSVAFLLTDEGLMTDGPGDRRWVRGGRGARGGAGAGGSYKVAKVPLAERNNVDHTCFPTAEEAKWHSGVKMIHSDGGMDAPYFEDLDPKPAREVPPVTGKRHVKPHQSKQQIFIDPSKPATNEELAAANLLPNRKSNKSNESVNVLRLDTYSAQQLHEPRPTTMVLGPRKWTAPDMPPKPRPYFTQAKVAAKEEHDVIGNGRWGTRDEPRKEGVGRGACRPRRDEANLFAGDEKQRRRRSWVPPSEVRKPTAQQRKYAGQPNLLKYYDPNVDGAAPQPKPKPHGNRTNEESKVEVAEFHPSRAPGAYSKNGASSGRLLW